MKRTAALGLVCMFCIATAAPTAIFAGGKAPPRNQPLVAISGSDSQIHEPSLTLAVNDEEWQQVWAAHLGTSIGDYYRPAMEVDFDRCMVVCILGGDTVNSAGIRIDSVLETDESILVRFRVKYFQTVGADNDKPPERPYAFVVVEKSRKAVVVEEDMRTPQNPRQPAWREWARIEAR